jgi:hypothetical protein
VSGAQPAKHHQPLLTPEILAATGQIVLVNTPARITQGRFVVPVRAVIAVTVVPVLVTDAIRIGFAAALADVAIIMVFEILAAAAARPVDMSAG